MTEEAAVAAAFLAALAREGIALPPEREAAAVADAIALHHQILLIRAACPAAAALPMGFVPPGAA